MRGRPLWPPSGNHKGCPYNLGNMLLTGPASHSACRRPRVTGRAPLEEFNVNLAIVVLELVLVLDTWCIMRNRFLGKPNLSAEEKCRSIWHGAASLVI